ncbi:MAG: hypothetical protein JXR52_04015 [Bacteroidales bacterium]|nr:hypothetical protein [Bacteroidales bacterium]
MGELCLRDGCLRHVMDGRVGGRRIKKIPSCPPEVAAGWSRKEEPTILFQEEGAMMLVTADQLHEIEP